MEAERKSRRALGDIGNLVTIRGVDGKPLPQVSRQPGVFVLSKLLANAEAAAADKNKNLLAAKGSLSTELDLDRRRELLPGIRFQRKLRLNRSQRR
ncbi:hypothetical protein ACS0TY_025251 [Phlomoides rotata]